MSLQLNIRRKPRAGKTYQRLHRAQEAAQMGAARAAEQIGPAAQHAREATSVRISDARGWTAPRLERAAHYVEDELGPRVGSLLHTTAHKVEPARSRNRRRMVATVLLVAGTLVGALGAMASRRRTKHESTEDDDTPTAAETSVSDNGQVRTP